MNQWPLTSAAHSFTDSCSIAQCAFKCLFFPEVLKYALISGSLSTFFHSPLHFFKMERMTWWQDVKMMLDCVTLRSNEEGKFISDSITTCCPGEHESSVAKLWPLQPAHVHPVQAPNTNWWWGGTLDGWLRSVVGYFRIHLLCVI